MVNHELGKIAFANAKGGVGKTSAVVNVGAGLALGGYRTLLVDLDSQGQVSKALGMAGADPTLAELMAGEAALEEVLLPARDNLDVIAGGKRLASTKQAISLRRMRPEMALSEALKGLTEHGYDCVLLDTAPSWDVLNINCLFYADYVMVPVNMEVLALEGLGDFLESVEDVRDYRPDLEILGVIPTFYDGRVKKSAEVLAQLKQHFGALVGPPIRYSVRLSEAPGFGCHVFEYDGSSRGAEDYRALIDYITRETGRSDKDG